MLPVSGALQLKDSAAICARPVSSAMYAYSTVDRPGPRLLSVSQKFHSPCFLASSLRPSRISFRLAVGQRPAVTYADFFEKFFIDRHDPVFDECLDGIQKWFQSFTNSKIHRIIPIASA
jgi:hypothetical protein